MKEAPHAVSLEILPGEVRDLSVHTLESYPPQFVLHGVRTMPTPGWELRVDRVEEELDARGVRISVYVTEVAPKGIVPQVLAPAELRVPLGAVLPGRHLVVLLGRRGEEGEYEPFAGLVVQGKGPDKAA